MRNPIAYNYDTQQWETGAAAAATRRKQLREELDLLKGPEGVRFAEFSGIPDITAAIACLEQQLAALNSLN